MERPFATGVVVGALGLLAWWNRGRIAAFARRVTGGFHGLGDGMPGFSADSAPGIAVRQIRRYAFAAMQDKSPIVGLTHASYALMGMDLLEETVGREAIKAAGYDPMKVRALITKLQDQHAEALKSADPYIQNVLDLERKEGYQLPGFVMAGAAPMGA